MDDKVTYVYYEVHAYEMLESSPRQREVNLLTTDDMLARGFTKTLLDCGYNSISFDKVETTERLVLQLKEFFMQLVMKALDFVKDYPVYVCAVLLIGLSILFYSR